MANTAAIVIIVIGIILLALAVGLGLYFYFRGRNTNSQNGASGNNGNTSGNTATNGGGTNNPPSNPLPPPLPLGPAGTTGPTGPSGTTGPSAPTGPSGPSGPTPPPPNPIQTIAVSPDIESKPFSGVWAPNGQTPNQLSIVSTDSGTACKNYLFKYSNFTSAIGQVFTNALVWQGDNKSIVYAEGAAGTNFNNSGVAQIVTVRATDTINVLNTDAANWSYDTTNKTWCLTNHPNVCLFYQQFSELVLSGQNVGDRSFQWDYGTLPSTFAPCTT